MNGIVCHADLPPIFRVPKTTNNKPTILSQKVTITGLGATFFQEVMEALKEVNFTAEREFRQGELEAWTPTTFKGAPAMECTNRYLKQLREDLNNVAIPFPKEVDPRGALKQLTRPDLAHTEENSVQCIRCLIDGDGKRKYTKAKPQVFRIGDIVEVQMTLAVVRGEKNKVRMKPILRAIVLLNGDYTQEALRAQSANAVLMTKGGGMRTKSFKRKLAYIMEEEYVDMDVEDNEGPRKKQMTADVDTSEV
ncbi:uncharacterized protein ARMOST_19520 [Armillaria ostoyae]|uniref:Uncharacterized protein n=1 Tax=Armillaria ostoyae TaxID=47428 RepID=A0A284S4X1_ARMOS|nr:uncharacterized protein ARMOST_19520 [Armillaria ostoyae]